VPVKPTFTVFTSRPAALLATEKASCVLASYTNNKKFAEVVNHSCTLFNYSRMCFGVPNHL
jgi:hypothetical protein